MAKVLDSAGARDAGAVDRPFTLPEAQALASSVHGSLYLDGVLRACWRKLETRVGIDRVDLVQHRSTELTATIYSVDDDGGRSLIGPRIIALKPSRLQSCLATQSSIRAVFAGHVERDAIETELLLRPAAAMAVYMPLRHENVFKGMLVVSFADPVKFSPGDDQFLGYLAEQMALAVDNSDFFYRERRRVRQLTMVSDIAKLAVAFENLDEFLRSTA